MPFSSITIVSSIRQLPSACELNRIDFSSAIKSVRDTQTSFNFIEAKKALCLELCNIKVSKSEDASDVLPPEFMPTNDEVVRRAKPDDSVILWRGTHRFQAENIKKNKTASGLIESDVSTDFKLKPKKTKPSKYTKVNRINDQVVKGRKLPEYTANKDVGNGFARGHYLVVIEVKRGLLSRGSISESGWILNPNARVNPLAIVDCTLGKSERFTPNAS